MTCEPLIVSGHQPCYHAYLPTVAKLVASDIFVVADDLPFSRSLFQHRQRFDIDRVPRWITLPVERSSDRTAINKKRLRIDPGWQQRHLDVIERSLGDAPHFDIVADSLTPLYSRPWDRVIDIDLALWSTILLWFAPTQEPLVSSQLPATLAHGKGARIASELRVTAPTGGIYLAGAGSRYLLELDASGRRHIDVVHDAGFVVKVVGIDAARLACHTNLASTSPAIALLAHEGSAARSILADSIVLTDLE